MKSIYYKLLMYFYKNGDEETRDFIKLILEQQAIKRKLIKYSCK